METADYLSARDIKATLLEMSLTPPVSKLTTHGWWMYKRLKEVGGTLLLGALEEQGIPHVVVGDALSPRRLIEAVHEGHAAGLGV